MKREAILVLPSSGSTVDSGILMDFSGSLGGEMYRNVQGMSVKASTLYQLFSDPNYHVKCIAPLQQVNQT